MAPHRVLYDERAIARRVGELAADIRRDCPRPDPVLVGLLTGSFVFMADLVRELSRLGAAPEIDFVAASHYASTTAPSGVVEVHKEIATDLAGRAVLLIDDILDTGWSLGVVRERVAEEGPAWLRTCVLLDKPSRRKAEIEADYTGFQVPDFWVVGYGMDEAGRGRGLPYVAVAESEDEGPGG